MASATPAPPIVATPPPPKVIAVELIQGIRRATQNFEEQNTNEEGVKPLEEVKRP
jgi:hypothetical protein